MLTVDKAGVTLFAKFPTPCSATDEIIAIMLDVTKFLKTKTQSQSSYHVSFKQATPTSVLIVSYQIYESNRKRLIKL